MSGYLSALAAREPDWAGSRDVLDEMIAEAGGLDEQDRAWARQALDPAADPST